jgi:hypothetical protein
MMQLHYKAFHRSFKKKIIALIFLTILENIEISKKNKIEVISKGHLYWYLQYVYNVD